MSLYMYIFSRLSIIVGLPDLKLYSVFSWLYEVIRGGSRGGGIRDQDPPPFEGPLNFIKKEQTLRVGVNAWRFSS